MDALKTVVSIYRELHEAAPSTDAARRFLQDMASWAVFTLLARLCRGVKPDPRSEREMIGLASLAGLGYRAMGPDWLPDQLSRASLTLQTPSMRERGSEAARAYAAANLPAEALERAARLRQSGAVTMAARNAANLPGALSEFEAYMRASGSYERGRAVAPAEFGDSTRESFVKKVRSSLNGLAPAILAFGDDPTGAVLVNAWVASKAWEAIVEPLVPTFDETWVADFEIASEDAEDAANFERHAAEEQSIREDVMSRTAAYADRFGSH